MKVYAVRSDEEDFLEVFSSLESAMDCGISLIREFADKYSDEDDDEIERIIKCFKIYEFANISDFDISIYHLTLNE